MELHFKTLAKSLNKAYLKEKVGREQIDRFSQNLNILFQKIDNSHTEETLKDFLTEFLRNTWYNPDHAITVNNDRKDLAIHSGKLINDPVAVILETKKIDSAEMITEYKPNVKAFHELVLYYLQERFNRNHDIKHLVATDVNNWIVFDANEFDKKIYGNSAIRKLFNNYKNDNKDNPFFYTELKKILDITNETITATFFNILNLKKIISNNNKEDDKTLIAFYKILSPSHLLKLPFANDSNSLDKDFYAELLHIIGLEEVKDGNKKIIQRKKQPNEASLIENAIIKLTDKDCIRDLPDSSQFGLTDDIKLYNIALELTLTWVNRILFLKLLEAQLFAYNNNNKELLFLNTSLIKDFDELNNLFFQVLAEKEESRRQRLKDKFSNVPYLNSSLFERTELERRTIDISALDNSLLLPLHQKTILKDNAGKRESKATTTLEYLFAFLNSYDFTSEGKEEIQEENKTLINASVLGLIFEKINGYKDGAFFTPGAITMFMCKELLRKTIVQKFNDYYSWGCRNFEELQGSIDYTDKQKRTEANNIINNITICDPSVGSGHFLVSALNELIAIKHDLKILQYCQNNQRIREYSVEIVNDELILQNNETEAFFEYRLNQKGHIIPDLQQLQETLFYEKQTLIENCLFGVDLNPNSVKICRLRLWIELLKNAFYTSHSNYKQLETLPNIDINIKHGNSLLSRFALESDLTGTLNNSNWNINTYKSAVHSYHNAQSKEEKREFESLIESIKRDFRTEIATYDPINKKLNKLRGDLNKHNVTDLFGSNDKKRSKANKEIEKLTAEIKKLEQDKNNIQSNAAYKLAFEWRFEFPEVLDNEGNYIGFDAIIGNPPYIQLQKMGADSDLLSKQGFKTFAKTGDIYQLFYEQGFNLLKKRGHLCYITSNKWMRTDYGSTTRKFLSEECCTQLVVDFGMAQMFDSATTYTNILLASKSIPVETISMCRIKEDFDPSVLIEDYVAFAAVKLKNPGEKSWITYDRKQYDLITKIIKQGTEISNWNIRINRGLLTGFNEAFIIDQYTRDKLISEDPSSEDLIKPLLRGEDIKSYYPNWANLYIIGTFPSLKIDIDSYPAIRDYLARFKNRLNPKPKDYNDINGKWPGRKSGPYKWFETQDTISYYKEFLKPKIIYPNMTKYLPFVYDKHQFFSNDKSFILTGEHLEYLVCFLNSSIFKFTFKEYFPELLGETRELRKVFFENVTIKPAFDENWFREKIDLILAYKTEGLSTKELELMIDEKFFEYYELTVEERSIINESVGTAYVSEALMSSSSASVSE